MVNVQLIAQHAAERDFAYLITLTPKGRIHTSVVHPQIDGERVTVTAASDRVRTNAAAHAEVSLVWPPADGGGYSLIVDGPGEVADDLTIVPTRAILHRPAEEPGDGPGCVQDCIEL